MTHLHKLCSIATIMLVILLAPSIAKAQKDTTAIAKKPIAQIKLVSNLDRLAFTGVPQEHTMAKQRNIYNVKSLPIFCKIEHKMAKASKINVMMRLGSLDYVNRLEGKD